MFEPDFEPQSWFHPTLGYFLISSYRPIRYLHVRMGGVEVVERLPSDVVRVNGVPTQWAYDQACAALKRHTERADNADGEAAELVGKILPVIGGDWSTPPDLKTAVFALLSMTRFYKTEYDSRAVDE